MARKKARRSSSTALAPRRSGGRFRSVARHVASKASEEKHMMGALIAAGALGIAEAQGITIPVIGDIGEAATLGLAAYGLDKFGIVKSRMLRHAATGLLSIAVFEFARKTGKGKKEGVHGDDMDMSFRND
jgi:hypothetical protein